MIAFSHPSKLSIVLLINSSLDWVRTWIVTSLGMCPSKINSLTKLKSVSDADGNPTSISLYPISTSFLKNAGAMDVFLDVNNLPKMPKGLYDEDYKIF